MKRNDLLSPLRFALLATARSGSTHIIETLDSHPAVCSRGEILNPDDPRWDRIGLRRPGMTAAQLLEVGFTVEREGETTAAVEVIGFKVLDEHIIAGGPYESILDLLAKDPDLRIIVLQRLNLLESVRSRVQAAQIGWYHWPQDGPDRPGPHPVVHLDYELCLSAFQRAESFYAEIECRFPADRTLRLSYEDEVCGDFPATMSRVLEFLGVRPFPLRPALVKLENRPAEQVVANYADLERAFQGSRYHRYFRGKISREAL